MSLIERHWYRRSLSVFAYCLLPLSLLFRCIVSIRFFLYRIRFKKIENVSVPVIVVGNITVGGTGKTPFVIWLCHALQKKGYRPGIVSRGAGGVKKQPLYCVDAQSDPRDVGDEAVLLAHRTACPLVVAVDRVLAARTLLEKYDCNIIISDDGLQHYRLGRDVEIVIVDGVRKFGNGHLLPAGPLREPINRLKYADCVITHGDEMKLVGHELIALKDESKHLLLSELRNQTVHAVAGIGNPERFFSALRARGLHVIEHSFPDHHAYKARDINFNDRLPVLMTEKDAVKCKLFSSSDERYWYLPVVAELPENLIEKIVSICSVKSAMRRQHAVT